MSSNGLIPGVSSKLLKLCRDLRLLDDFRFDGDRIVIRHGTRIRSYSPDEAAEFIGSMLAHAPTLQQIAEHHLRPPDEDRASGQSGR